MHSIGLSASATMAPLPSAVPTRGHPRDRTSSASRKRSAARGGGRRPGGPQAHRGRGLTGRVAGQPGAGYAAPRAMLLAIDVGNTNIVVGAYRGEALLPSVRLKP